MITPPLLNSWLPPRFDWRSDNQFELLIDGQHYFAPMLAAINNASQSIDLEMYLVASGKLFTQFRDALIQAAARGVTVRLLLDDYGSQALLRTDRDLLTRSGIQMQFYNRLRWRQGLRNFFRDHRKLLLVDNQVAFVGGTGLTDDFIDTDNKLAWHEVMLRIQGPVLQDWLMLFEHTWLRRKQRRRHQPTVLLPQAKGLGRVCASSGLRGHHVTQSLYQQIHRAKRRIWLVTPYFVPTLRLRYLLGQAARRGVDVRILVPGLNHDHPMLRHASRRMYGYLLRYGVRIFEYQPRFIHVKLALCDDWISLGSTNFDRWNIYWNLDANQEIISADFATHVAQLFDHDCAHSTEITVAAWQRRPWHERMMEVISSWIDRWPRH